MSRELWQAVLARAIDDAVNGISKIHSSPERREVEIGHTRRFLTIPNEDLDTVCALAGLDPVAVMERMRKRIAKAPSAYELAHNPLRAEVSANAGVSDRKREPGRGGL